MSSERLVSALAIAGLSAALFSACGISSPSSNKTDTFSGTVAVAGIGPVHNFTVTQSGGEVSIKITSLSPDTGATLGVRYGPYTSSTECLANAQTGVAGLNKTALSGLIAKGNFCLLVFDSGLITRAETYTITVSHP